MTNNESSYIYAKYRVANTCTIYVGVGGKIKLFGGTILKADASGYITIDGQVTCSGVGDCYCKPVECYELYQILK